MMQNDPFFSGLQIFYGKNLNNEEETIRDSWSITLGEMQSDSEETIGLFFMWTDSLSLDEIHFS